jgi:hypothetical protein
VPIVILKIAKNAEMINTFNDKNILNKGVNKNEH